MRVIRLLACHCYSMIPMVSFSLLYNKRSYQMEQGYELKLIDMRKAILEQTQPTALYIPLHGKHTTNPEEESFDLAQKIESFFEFNDASTSDTKVMLLMGDAGSGKSVFSQQL